jgi:hypothetical protein
MAHTLAAHSEADAREILTTFRAGINGSAHETPWRRSHTPATSNNAACCPHSSVGYTRTFAS